MKIGVISLGCDKNRVDTEKMLSRISEAGYEIVGSEEESDIIIINTCAFIDSAKKESIDEIYSALSFKEKSDNKKKVIVTGCLSQRYLDDLNKGISDVDAYLGVCNYDDIIDAIKTLESGKKFRCTDKKDKFTPERVLTTPYHYAYLKIADGCNNHCTYCAIPSIRGKYVSEKMDDLIKEASKLADDGVKEIILVAQDVTRYGMDFDGKPHIIDLCRELEKLDFEWIRLLYLEPEMVTDELIEYISSSEKVVKYMDIPFQHADSEILKVMGRHTDLESTKKLVEKVKSHGIKLRTTFIVGFPGETEEKYNVLKDFVSEFRPDYAGFFAYSKEDGTPAARLKNQVDGRTKKSRAKEMTKIQTQIIKENNNSYIGKDLKIIYDDIDYDKQMFVGRTEFQTPDIDSVVYFKSDKQMNIGQFYSVRIEKTDGIDLIGSVL
ncbi:MAG: 30S ribosomal protein S12 methylthiotransferase RimO [Clostridia bacterium]|nr:30S ribosomal protein S12 methylthiotransferase RimO [Clostridia bacterium]